MVSVINLQLKPDIFQLHASNSTFNSEINDKENEAKPILQHRPWCSFHPKNIQEAVRNKFTKRTSKVTFLRSKTSKPGQSVPDKFHHPKLFENKLSNYEALTSSYYRSELDLRETDLPDKDIKILQLLVRK